MVFDFHLIIIILFQQFIVYAKFCLEDFGLPTTFKLNFSLNLGIPTSTERHRMETY